MRLKEKIEKETLPKLSKEYKFPILGLPRIYKLTVNVGVGKVKESKEMLKTIEGELTQITGQKPKPTQAKKSISGFKIREGQQVGFCVTLRGNRMWDFTEKLNSVAFPRIRDFGGLKKSIRDKNGNFTIGLKEQLIFPEISLNDVKESWGMSLTYSIRNGADMRIVEKYLKEIGFIFI